MKFFQNKKALTSRMIKLDQQQGWCVQATLNGGNVTIEQCCSVFLGNGMTRKQLLNCTESATVQLTLDGPTTFLEVNGIPVEIFALQTGHN